MKKGVKVNNNLLKGMKTKTLEYGFGTGKVIAQTLDVIHQNITEFGESHAQQYMLAKGLKVFGKKG